MRTRLKGLTATLPLAAALLAVTAPASAQTCNKIVPVQLTIELYESSTAPAAARKVARTSLPAEICWVKRENSRYRIVLDGAEVWVATVQFSGVAGRIRPLKEPPERTPAGVKLGHVPKDGGPTLTGVGAAPDQPGMATTASDKGVSGGKGQIRQLGVGF